MRVPFKTFFGISSTGVNHSFGLNMLERSSAPMFGSYYINNYFGKFMILNCNINLININFIANLNK